VTRLARLLLLLLLLVPSMGAAPPGRFEAVDIFVDTADAPLAAWQFELTAGAGNVEIVGIENGEHPAFARPPYYDREANLQNRIIIAAYSTDAALPTGKTRVARLHLYIQGNDAPDYAVRLDVAAGPDGAEIPATVTTGGAR